jgi:hypothetical protein
MSRGLNWPPTAEQRSDLRDGIMRVLADQYPLPISTNELGDLLGVPRGPWHQEMYRQLVRFVRLGDVEKVVREGMYCRYWRLAVAAGSLPPAPPAAAAAPAPTPADECPWCDGTGKRPARPARGTAA